MKKILKIIFKYVFVFLIGFLACTCSIKTNTKINALKTNNVRRAYIPINVDTITIKMTPNSFNYTCASLIMLEASPQPSAWNGETIELRYYDKNGNLKNTSSINISSTYKVYNLLIYNNVQINEDELALGYQLIGFNDSLQATSDSGLHSLFYYNIDNYSYEYTFISLNMSNKIKYQNYFHAFDSLMDNYDFGNNDYMQQNVYTPSLLYDVMSQQIQTLNSQISQLNTQINLLNSNIARLQNEISTKDDQINSLNRQLTNIQNAYDELQTQYNDLNLTYTTLNTQYQSLSAEHQQLQQDYEAIHYAFENMRSHLAVVERDFEEYKSTNTNFSNPLDAIKKILSTFAPLLDKELFPHITIGNILLIPITFKIVEMFLTLVGGKK